MELRAQGASFVNNSKDSGTFEVVREVIAELPDADKKARFEEFEKRVADYEECQREMRWYFFVNMHSYLTGVRHRPGDHDARLNRQAERLIQQREMSERIEHIKQQIMLLDLRLPNGKLLRDSTFAECAKAGGWFTKIARKGKPSQIVGNVLTEEQVRAVNM